MEADIGLAKERFLVKTFSDNSGDEEVVIWRPIGEGYDCGIEFVHSVELYPTRNR